jgi:hypothetical protein
MGHEREAGLRCTPPPHRRYLSFFLSPFLLFPFFLFTEAASLHTAASHVVSAFFFLCHFYYFSIFHPPPPEVSSLPFPPLCLHFSLFHRHLTGGISLSFSVFPSFMCFHSVSLFSSLTCFHFSMTSRAIAASPLLLALPPPPPSPARPPAPPLPFLPFSLSLRTVKSLHPKP